MDIGSAHAAVSPSERAAIIAGACSADMAVNFPPWIVAKRASAGLGLPSLSELYKGSGSLLFAMGPMYMVADASTAATLDLIGDRLPPTPALCVSACVSGGVGALGVGCQIEGLITRAHATGHTVWETLLATRAALGISGVLVPYGALMIAAREIPYAGCLFFLSGYIRSQIHGTSVIGEAGGTEGAATAAAAAPEGGITASWAFLGRDLLSAALTACIAGPISHVPSVVAAHQQAHSVSISTACREIARSGKGLGPWFLGLLPRTCSLTGSLFMMPFAIETLQPIVERNRWRWRS